MVGYHTFYRVKLDKEIEKRGAACNLLILFLKLNNNSKEIMTVKVFEYFTMLFLSPGSSLKIFRCAPTYFLGVWKYDQTHSFAFDLLLHSKKPTDKIPLSYTFHTNILFLREIIQGIVIFLFSKQRDVPICYPGLIVDLYLAGLCLSCG